MERIIIDLDTGETTTVPLSDEELAALAELDRIAQAADQVQAAEHATETTLRSQAEAALGANRTWLKDGPFTSAATLAQVKALTKQNNGLIRLLLRKLDNTD